jgi:hypothetical protein
MPIQYVREICDYQGCQCQTCDFDKGGACAHEDDGGNCLESREHLMCPVRICPNWKPK